MIPASLVQNRVEIDNALSILRHRDDFYRQVALAYRRAVAGGRNPGKSLADDSGVPHGTVARWIAESRRRGHLPPAEKGKVTT